MGGRPDPAELAGEGGLLVDVLERVPTSRLVILGEPGAGKTMLAVRLVLDLAQPKRRPKGAPVPLLVSLASWNPRQQDLYGWLADRLVIDHPELTRPAPDGSERSQARALLDAGLVWPVLDGLDEIPDAVRGPAIAKLNDALRPGQRLVLTSRTQPYQAAVHPPNGVEVVLTGAAGIQLCPLDAAAVTDYLGNPPDSPTRHRWQPVLATLTTHPPPPVAQALRTPLMVGLAKTIYNPRPDEHTGTLPNPTELLDPGRFPDHTAVEQHLLDRFIPAAYRPHPDPKRTSRWPAAQAERWLVLLAHHLENRLHTTDLRWWEIPHATPTWLLKLAGGVVAGVVAGVAVGLAFGLAGGLAFGLAGGLAFGLQVGLEASPADLTAAASPGAVLIRDRSTFRVFMLTFGLAGGLVAGLVVGLAGGVAGRLTFMLAFGLAGGLTVGLLLGISQAAWPWFAIARGWLAVQGQLPWTLMAFLADAHQRGVLRQVGAVYQFRHAELQHRLATRS